MAIMVVYFFVFFGTMTSWGQNEYGITHHMKYVIKYGVPSGSSRRATKLTEIDNPET